MKYFLDTEFIEGFKKPIKWLPTIDNFNKSYHSIQLISIGIVAEDGREYYAISNEFNPADANDWVKKNVISKLPSKHFNGMNAYEARLWKSNKQIAKDIVEFCKTGILGIDVPIPLNKRPDGFVHQITRTEPEFYGYYADYDWVLFCSLFGTMMDLPNGFPMYCNDLKQMFDFFEHNFKKRKKLGSVSRYLEKIDSFKQHKNYPKQENEHDALDDARWNQKLYNFLQNI